MLRVTVEGEVIAYEPERDTGEMSFVFFCPGCGRTWAKIERGTGWYSVSRWCGKHTSEIDIPGSLFQRYDWWPGVKFGSGGPGLEKFLLAHPKLRRHEFEAHMRWAEAQS